MKRWLKKNNNYLLIAGLLVLYILSVLVNLGHLNLRVEEPRRAIVSMAMLKSGNFIDPHTMGWAYYNKPPVFNWIMAGFMKLTGSESEFVCRLPSVISLLLLGFFQFLFSKKYLGRRLALLSSFFVVTCADMYFYWLSNGAEIDVFYSLIVYLQVISIFWCYEKKNYWCLFICSWLLCAVGFFTKGYTSLLFQFLTLGSLCIYARSLKILFKLQHLAGIAVFFLVVFSFLYVYSFFNSPQALMINLLNESLLKSAVGQESAGKLYKIFSYPFVLFRVLAPWCLILFFLLKKHRFGLLNNPLVRFSLLFIVMNIGVYWVTGAQKTRYVIMFIPFVMNIVVYVVGVMEKNYQKQFNSWLKYAGFFFLLILIGLFILPFFTGVNKAAAIFFALLMLVFIIQYFKMQQYRIWLFVTGVILTRLIYAGIGIPLKKEREFDYNKMAVVLAAKNNFKEVRFFGMADTMNLNVVFIDTIFKWKQAPVKILKEPISYQVPYYFYKATGVSVQYDTIMRPGQTYISYPASLKEKKITTLGTYYDKQVRDTLVLFRPVAVQGQ